jgi:hypothetical protein
MTLDFSKCKTLEDVQEVISENEKQLEEAKKLLRGFENLRRSFYESRQKTLLTEQGKNS